MKMRGFNVTYSFMSVGTVRIDVPVNLSFDEAIMYAKEHLAEIPLPSNAEYVQDSDIIDEENCDFEEE